MRDFRSLSECCGYFFLFFFLCFFCRYLTLLRRHRVERDASEQASVRNWRGRREREVEEDLLYGLLGENSPVLPTVEM